MAKTRRSYRNQGNGMNNNFHAPESMERTMENHRLIYPRDLSLPPRPRDPVSPMLPSMSWSPATVPATNGPDNAALAFAPLPPPPPPPPPAHPPQDVFHRWSLEPWNMQHISATMHPSLQPRAHHAAMEGPDRLFLEEYRSPGPQQIYEPPQFHASSMEQACQPENEWKASIAGDQRDVKTFQLRGDAPVFVPRAQCAAKDVLKPKEFTWMVVSST